MPEVLPSLAFAMPEKTFIKPAPNIGTIRDGRSFVHLWSPFDVSGRDGRTTEVTLRRATTLLSDPRHYRSGRTPVWWIGAGTALGFARDGGFVEGDTDIDIRIGLRYRGNTQAFNAVASLLSLFEKHGFRLRCEAHFDGRPMQLALIDTRNHDVVLDLYFFYTGISEGHYVNATPLGYRRKPAHLIENLGLHPWPGSPDIKVYAPGPIEAYLEWRYGPEWHIRKTREQMGPRDQQCYKPLPQVTVLTYGTWDLFHHGHERLLERANEMGDDLIVGVVSDEISRQRGKHPAQDENTRAARIRALPYVKDVFIKREQDAKQIDIERFGASYVVIGNDWQGHPRYTQIEGYRGVEVRYLERTPDISSTILRQASTASPTASSAASAS